jgi:hypothetical protein
MQHGDNHPTNRGKSDDQPTNRPLNLDESRATDSHTSRLGEKYTVREAADLLGTSVDAVRGRLRRGTLDSIKVDGVVYVLLDEVSCDRHADTTIGRQGWTNRQNAANRDQSELLEELRNQNEWLRREIERKDTIIMSLAQRIPELEAPPEPRKSPKTPSEERDEGELLPKQEKNSERRSWLYRFFFGT